MIHGQPFQLLADDSRGVCLANHMQFLTTSTHLLAQIDFQDLRLALRKVWVSKTEVFSAFVGHSGFV